jgi:hypothetical protein
VPVRCDKCGQTFTVQPTVTVHGSRVTPVQVMSGTRGGRSRAMPAPEGSGWGRQRLRGAGEAGGRPLCAQQVCIREGEFRH